MDQFYREQEIVVRFAITILLVIAVTGHGLWRAHRSKHTRSMRFSVTLKFLFPAGRGHKGSNSLTRCERFTSRQLVLL